MPFVNDYAFGGRTWRNICEKFIFRSFAITAREEYDTQSKWLDEIYIEHNAAKIVSNQLYVQKFTWDQNDRYRSLEGTYLRTACSWNAKTQVEFRRAAGIKMKTVDDMNLVERVLEDVLCNRTVAFNQLASRNFEASNNTESPLLLDYIVHALESLKYKIPKQLLHKTRAQNTCIAYTEWVNRIMPI